MVIQWQASFLPFLPVDVFFSFATHFYGQRFTYPEFPALPVFLIFPMIPAIPGNTFLLVSEIPSCVAVSSVPTKTFLSEIVVTISPGKSDHQMYRCTLKFFWFKFQIFSAERMTIAGSKIYESHLVAAPTFASML